MKTAKLKRVYIALGSNMGDREDHLYQARNIIADKIGEVILESRIYETEPWGYADQPYFLNQVVLVRTRMTPREVLEILLRTEMNMGRVRTFKNASRIIDLDILFYDHEIINEENLIIPHPSIPARKFVLKPLAEIASGLIHPVLKKSVKSLLEACEDPLKVRALNQTVHS